MQKIIFLFACLASAGHAQRLQAELQSIHHAEDHSVDAAQNLAELLLASNPAAAFNPSGAIASRGHTLSYPGVATRANDLSMMAKAKKAVKKAVAKKPVPKKVVKKAAPKKAAPKKVVKKAAPKKVARKVAPRKSAGEYFLTAGFTSGAAADAVGRSDTSWVDVFDPNGLGYFDPAGFTIGKTEKQVLAYREAELKHGRIAMMAALGFVVQEKFHPLFGGEVDTPSAYALLDDRIWDKAPVAVLAAILTTIFLLEAVSSLSVFANQGRGLPDDYTPGDVFKPLGGTFDPLGLAPSDPVEFEVMQTKELNNGRLAMLAILGMFLQEVKTGQPLFA